MAPATQKRRRAEAEVKRPKKKPKIKRQTEYHSSSEDDEGQKVTAIPDASAATGANGQPMSSGPRPKSILKKGSALVRHGKSTDTKAQSGKRLENGDGTSFQVGKTEHQLEDESIEDDLDGEMDRETEGDSVSEEDSEDEERDDAVSERSSMTSSNAARTRKKRNDPEAFATSISRILDTKLSSSKRQDPVLSRSKSAAEANKSLTDAKLDQKARAQIRAERKQALDRGRVKDVLGLNTPEVDTGAILEEEKRFKKIAQRGVVKLFNAVRAAQVKAEEGMKQARAEGIVGMKQREDRVNEMSKQGFLDLISSGGKQVATT